MQQFQSLKRLLIFYTLTLLIMLALYYAMMFLTLQTNSQHHSQMVFDSLQHEINEHVIPTDDDIKKILTKPFFQDISYQLILMLPSGQTYIHSHTRPREYKFTTFTFPRSTSQPISSSSYQLNSQTLMGKIKLESNHQIYIVLRHQPIKINWVSYQYWLPLMTAIMLFILALLYMFKRRGDWVRLMHYIEALITTSKKAYTPPPFIKEESTFEFLYLGHALGRVSYQLHDNHRRIKTLSNRLERLVDQAPLPMLMIKRQGQISFFNQRFAQIFNPPFVRDTHYSLIDFVIGSDEETQKLLQKLSTQRVTRTLLVYGIDDKQAYQLHITPWFGGHGQMHGFTVLLNNVDNLVSQTESLQLENHQLQLQIKEFIKLRSIIGHELRTPLNAIIGTLDLIEAYKLSARQQEVLTTLIQSSQSMLAMLNDMLDMAKIKAGKADIVTEPTDIFKLGQHISDLMVGSARRQEISLLYFFAPDCPRYITTDSSRVRQILLNLLDNGIKFTPSGSVALLIEPVTHEQMQRSKRTDKRNLTSTARAQHINIDKGRMNNIKTATQHHWIRFSVKDTGIGVAKAEQHKLFSYFNQANEQISQNYGGTGLGLAISNSFAQLLGGFIQLDSDGHSGSTFALYLPCIAPTYQPVYHFHSSLAHIRLIVIVNQELCATCIQRICSHLSLPLSVYTCLDSSASQQLHAQLKQDAQKLTPVLLLDYEYYEANHVALTDKLALTGKPAIKSEETANGIENNNVIDDLLNNASLPKILLSMKPERSMPSTLLDHFDGFLNKPLDISLLLSELIRLTQPILKAKQQENVTKDSGDKAEPTKETSLAKEEETTKESSPDKVLVTPLILVVDDNITNQKITCKLLSRLGYRSMVADDGQQALDRLKLQRSEIALILMDCRMPVMDGLQATQAIRAQGDDVPIVALTANNTEEDRDACFAVGMNEFLAKPISKDKLLAILQQFINT
ncbi:response regulator [Psychrobacter sp. CAL346-MNA-CIBAN-0220]|uniref:response regulator n=1 Tax=Psychrobacter sp. CAL346-MNA-CIBAN-0220 TaxID=3140457 RepID=UPI0033224B53